MNPVFTEAAGTLTSSNGAWMGALTGFFLLFFLAWVVWAWAPRNRSSLEAAAHMPLDDDEGGGA